MWRRNWEVVLPFQQHWKPAHLAGWLCICSHKLLPSKKMLGAAWRACFRGAQCLHQECPLPPAAAEPVDTTGWYDKVMEGRREVGAPDVDQVTFLPYDKVVEPEKGLMQQAAEVSLRQQAHTCKKGRRDTYTCCRGKLSLRGLAVDQASSPLPLVGNNCTLRVQPILLQESGVSGTAGD